MPFPGCDLVRAAVTIGSELVSLNALVEDVGGISND